MIALGMALGISGCVDSAAAKSYNRDSICIVDNWGDGPLESCQDGDVVLWKPGSWGNEQMPVVAAAMMCDFSMPIVYTTGAVTCVYRSAGYKTYKAMIEAEAAGTTK